MTALNGIPLGKQKNHSPGYDPSQLFPVSRKEARNAIGVSHPLPFTGKDIWNCYELSWLNTKGKPDIAIARFVFPFDSDNIIESKSVKLYLNSLNQTCFQSADQVRKTIEQDFSRVSGKKVEVHLIRPGLFNREKLVSFQGTCLDNLDVDIIDYQINPELLRVKDKKTSETVFSHLLRTICPVTGQPDWASIMIEYTGMEIDHKGLLKYLISMRNHTGFHENCVETIFMDIFNQCRPEKLLVYARFTRRGGVDINPFRSNYNALLQDMRLTRQ